MIQGFLSEFSRTLTAAATAIFIMSKTHGLSLLVPVVEISTTGNVEEMVVVEVRPLQKINSAAADPISGRSVN